MKLLVNIDVPDLDAAIRFYRDAVGLALSRVIDGDVAELTGAASTVYLLKKDPATPANARANRDYSRHWTPVHMDFVVNDIQSAVDRALAAGAQKEGGCVQWKGSKCVSFSDPFGNGFCLIELTGGTYAD